MKITIDRRPVVYNVPKSVGIAQAIAGGVVGVASLVFMYFILKEANK